MTTEAGLPKRPVFGARLLRSPRIVRILIAAVFAFATALLVDRLFAYSYYQDSASSTFSISVFFGLVSYIIGWWQLIGFGPTEPQPRRFLPLYVSISLILLIVAVVLTVGSALATYGTT